MFPPIYALLTDDPAVYGIVNIRVFPHGEAPQDTTKPYVTWFLVTSAPENNLSAIPNVDKCTVQIDCWHKSSSGVVELATAVRNAIESSGHVIGIIINQREPDTRLYRLAMQYDYFLNR